LGQPPFDVDGLELVEASEYTSTGNTTEDVGSRALHHGHEALVLEDLHTAVDGAVVLDGGAGSHHHTTPDGVDGVGHETGGDGHAPAQQEGQEDRGVVSQEDGLEGVVQAEVHASVDEDAHAGDGEATVQALDTVGLDGLGVDVDETVELALATLALGIIGQPGTGVVKGVDEHKGQGASAASGQDVGSEFLPLGSILGGLKDGLDGILESEVQGLGREVPEHISQITSPEGNDTLGFQGPLNTINNAVVWSIQSALFDHFSLILDQEFYSLDGSGGRFGNGGGNSGQHEVLKKSKLLLIGSHFELFFELSRKKRVFE